MKCEKFTDDRHQTTDDGRQVMAIVHMDLIIVKKKHRIAIHHPTAVGVM